jgi:hypothetical protein
MHTFSSLVAAISLLLTVASLLVYGGVLFASLLFFPLFLLGLAGVFAGVADRSVRQHDPSMNPGSWRDGGAGDIGVRR